MKTILMISVLALSLWAIPGLATPSQKAQSRGQAVASAAKAAHAAKHLDVQLRSDWKDVARLHETQAANGLARVRSNDGIDSTDHWQPSSKPDQVGSAVPEPSAMMLFGVGVLLSLQAIPRRSRRSSSVAE